jgi:peptidoglycan hydrolase CwlO-like protein
MENQDVLEIERFTKKANLIQTLTNAGIAIACALAVVYAFYFNTTATLADHSQQIKDIHTDVNGMKEDLKNVAVFKGVSETEINELKGKVDNIDSKMDKMNDKLDRILLKNK